MFDHAKLLYSYFRELTAAMGLTNRWLHKVLESRHLGAHENIGKSIPKKRNCAQFRGSKEIH